MRVHKNKISKRSDLNKMMKPLPAQKRQRTRDEEFCDDSTFAWTGNTDQTVVCRKLSQQGPTLKNSAFMKNNFP